MPLLNTVHDGFIYATAAAGPHYSNSNGTTVIARVPPLNTGWLARSYFEFLIADIPIGVPIIDSSLECEVIAPVSNPAPAVACEIRYLPIRPSDVGVTPQNIWNAFASAQSVLLTTWTITASGTFSIPLGDAADADIAARRNAQTWYTIGIRFANENRVANVDRYNKENSMNNALANPVPRLNVTY